MLYSTLRTAHLENKRVFLRADLNVPLHKGKIVDDYRLESLLPTLNLLCEKKSHVVVATHIGRPHDREAELSTKLLVPWFKERNYNVVFHENLEELPAEYPKNTILLLENLRFYAGEKKQDPSFARLLASYGDYYVNDAFGSLHRHDTSLTLLAMLFDAQQRSIGLLVEKELQRLSPLLHPAQPFVLIIGGGKVADKIPFIKAMIDKIHALLIGPALVFTFLKAYGKSVGKSLVNEDCVEDCKKLIAMAQERGVMILMPSDYMIALDSFNGPLQERAIPIEQFPNNGVGITLGQSSAELFSKEIVKGKIAFYNGLMGDINRPITLTMMREIFNAMSKMQGLSIIGGGDSVAAARILKLEHKIGFLSTGGGATLAYISGQKLPGLQAFLNG